MSTIEEEGKQVKYEIKYRPSYSLLEVHLPPNGMITAEAGAMTYMSSNIEVKTRTRLKESGIWGTIKVSLLGGETLFINDYVARDVSGKAGFVSAPLGDITRLEVSPYEGYIVQSAAYIASTPGVKLDTEWQGFTKGLFGQNLFMIKTLGEGDLFINTFGAIDKHELREGEKLIVDNFHLAALSTTCQYKVRMFGGLKSTILGGEGLITEVTGPGIVYIQTKNPQEFINWLWRYIGPRVKAEADLRSRRFRR
ncbi:MAG: TIGR00266 family protein [Candidatus Bathyarchaeia archaeon]